MSRQRRRRRRNLSEEEDYISRLPDSIIIDEILSRLPSTKEAVKTGVLSTKWKHLWTSNPNLKFSQFDIRDDQGYASFVNKTLILHSSNKVRKFFLRCYHDIFDEAWLCFAIRHGVEDLNLDLFNRTTTFFPYDEDCIRYQIPQDLYAHSSIIKLRTKFCDYAPKAEVSWTSLKVLNIREAALTEDVLQRILAGTPLLEYLELYECWGTNSIQVSSTSALKELVIREWLDPRWLPAGDIDVNTLEISIPSVKSLELSGAWQTKCLLLDASSLVEAHLTEFSEFNLVIEEGDIQEYASMVNEMLRRVTFVHELSVGPMFLRALSCLKEALTPPGWSLEHCKSLNLSMGYFKRNLLAISIFLNSASTNLEELSISLNGYDKYGFDGGNLIKEEDCWSSLEHLQFMKLKVISIWLGSFDPRNDSYDYLLGFGQFMLQKATVLEKMIIISPKSCPTARKLLTALRRCSPKAEIIFDD
ncbi:hypothetical protein COLO4_31577 [Corchorus olitorius]|uniref:At1g61320/AtMIF1 LRR domain-containing protein n=1 Tax=Corchorus olitorius TaxID=93759 RepID=A0A1R3H440_9ROSI|nr:hypothetical protein COLO4_31577 [Corchorus olitorius]